MTNQCAPERVTHYRRYRDFQQLHHVYQVEFTPTRYLFEPANDVVVTALISRISIPAASCRWSLDHPLRLKATYAKIPGCFIDNNDDIIAVTIQLNHRETAHFILHRPCLDHRIWWNHTMQARHACYLAATRRRCFRGWRYISLGPQSGKNLRGSCQSHTL